MAVFAELALIFAVTIVIAALMRLLKQPLIVGYIISGIIAGPFFLNIVRSEDAIAAFAQLGVAFLLFIVGLGLNPKVIREVGKVSLVTGIGHVVFTSLIGYAIGRMLG